MSAWLETLQAERSPLGWTLIGAALALLLAVLAMALLRRLAVRLTAGRPLLGLVVRRTHRPATVVLALAAAHSVLQAAPDTVRFIGALRHANGVLWIGAFTWLLLRWVAVTQDALTQRNSLDGPHNLHARVRITQVRVLSRSLYVVILVVGVAVALMTFPGVRQFGASLLASAGIAGLAVGLAARPVLSNLLAGLQLALTQPIRIDDVLVLEGEWGRVEEITGTYVVVKIWDERRLVVPLQYFIERPFQNWTRTSAELLGTVLLWVDYALPVAAVRAEVRRLCAQDPDWDGRVALVQVTDADARAMQLRVLLSSADSGRNFDLRCRVREGLIAYIAREHPNCLPCLRASTRAEADTPESAGALQSNER